MYISIYQLSPKNISELKTTCHNEAILSDSLLNLYDQALNDFTIFLCDETYEICAVADDLIFWSGTLSPKDYKEDIIQLLKTFQEMCI